MAEKTDAIERLTTAVEALSLLIKENNEKLAPLAEVCGRIFTDQKTPPKPQKKASSRKKKPGEAQITNYMLFRREQLVRLKAVGKGNEKTIEGLTEEEEDLISGEKLQMNLNQIIARRWKALSDEDKEEYKKLADEENKQKAAALKEAAGTEEEASEDTEEKKKPKKTTSTTTTTKAKERKTIPRSTKPRTTEAADRDRVRSLLKDDDDD